MKKILLLALAILLAGCQSINDMLPAQNGGKTTAPIVEPEIVEPPIVVAPPPKQYRVNWQPAINALISSLLTVDTSESSGNLLLIGQVRNQTNRHMPTQEIESLLISKLMNANKFMLIPSDSLYEAKQVLGIAADDNLITRSKLIGLARYVHADLILNTTLAGSAEKPSINMQLMLTNSGELLWSKSQPAMLEEIVASEEPAPQPQ